MKARPKTYWIVTFSISSATGIAVCLEEIGRLTGGRFGLVFQLVASVILGFLLGTFVVRYAKNKKEGEE